jgi:hypothetical protein
MDRSKVRGPKPSHRTVVDMPRSSYERMLQVLDDVPDAGAFPYQGGPLTEVAIPRWMIPWVNRFPMGPG